MSEQGAGGTVDRLSEMEKRVLDLLIGTGALTYAEIAEKLNVKPHYAKNLVNRILKKSNILYKNWHDNRNVVAVKNEFRSQYLGGDSEGDLE